MLSTTVLWAVSLGTKLQVVPVTVFVTFHDFIPKKSYFNLSINQVH